MATPNKLVSFCSVLMAAMFAYSASVQLNDHDWYFWFPLYALASAVNLMNWSILCKSNVRLTAKTSLGLGMFLFMKVAIEDLISGIAGFWSLDLSERVVREKIGSGLVVISMILHLKASSEPTDTDPRKRKRKELPRNVSVGMVLLVCFTYGLPFVFFVIYEGEMKF